jgi:nucleoside-specific outer membrane channel protein Tsx
VNRLFAAVLAAAAFVVAPLAARAQTAEEKEFVGFTTSNVQWLYGWNFADRLTGNSAENGQAMTITFNNFSEWKYGDSFFFADLITGKLWDFGQTPGTVANNAFVYAEWHPRVFLNRILGQKDPALGIFRNYGVAFEVNIGPGFEGWLTGVGMDLQLPGYLIVGANFYWRYTQIGAGSFAQYQNTWQFSPFWTLPFKIGPVPFVFTGFLDMFGAPGGYLDIMTQPQLLVDVLGLAGGKQGTLLVGLEWYLHTYQDPIENTYKAISAPQIMAQWTIH